MAGTLLTLTADCTTTQTLTVANGTTVDGGGHTINAQDPAGGFFDGAVLTNTGVTMNVRNLTIRGGQFAPNCAPAPQYGIFFNNASGTVSNTTVTGITQHSACPNEGVGIWAEASGAPRSVTITGATVNGFERDGVTASGMVTMTVSGSSIGPPDASPLSGATLPGQNSVEYVNGAGGTLTNSTIVARGFGRPSTESTGVLVFAATNVKIITNTITGAASDAGIAINGSTNTVVERNAIGRTTPDSPDTYGFGIDVQAGSQGTSLICNTFSGWRLDVSGALQPPCPSPTTVVSPSAGPKLPATGSGGLGSGMVARGRCSLAVWCFSSLIWRACRLCDFV